MISHEHRCIFIHIPKCAGTSIEAALGHVAGYNGRVVQDHRSIRMIQPLDGSELFRGTQALKTLARRFRHRFNKDQNPRNFLTVTRAQYRDYFKFTIVRNPWARVHSAWKNVTRDKNHYTRLGLTADTTLYDFVAKTRGAGMLKKQTDWLFDFQGSLAVDYVGRFEELETAFEHICSELSLETPKLPHAIRGNSGDYRKTFDNRTRKMVADFFANEIELFNYTFDKKNET